MSPEENKNSPDSPPLLSIITVTLNNANGLERTIKSVAAQGMKSFELIIIDGGSADGTSDLIKKYQDVISAWISEPDHGIYDAMNKGMALARGHYLNFLNAGDVYYNDSTLEMALMSEPARSSDFIYGHMVIRESLEKGGHLQKAMHFDKKHLLKFGTGVLCHQALFIRRQIAPGYDLRWRFKSELNWYFDILERSVPLKIMQVDEPFIVYSLGGFGQVNFWANQREWFRLIRHRFGWSAIFRYLLPVRLILKLPYRYKWIRHMLLFKKSEYDERHI